MQVLYGLGVLEAEQYVRNKLGSDFVDIGAVSHRLAILDTMEKTLSSASEAVLILQEGLPTQEEILLLDLISQIRMKYPKVRIVLLAGNHESGDAMLTALVGMGVYDIVYGEKCSMDGVVNLVLHPNTYAEAVKFLKPANYSVVREQESPTMVARIEDEVPAVEEERVYPKKLKTPSTPVPEPEDIPLEAAPPLVVQQTKLPTQKKKPQDSQKKEEDKLGKTKVISFLSCVSGMGNRETALSVATGLAMKGEKVVLIDCTNDNPLYLSRLDFTNESSGIYGAIREAGQGKVRQALYSPAVDVRSEDFKRLSKLPNSLFFLTFTLEDKQHKIAFDDLSDVVKSLYQDGIYDSIILCCSHMWDMELMDKIIHMSTIPFITTTQSSYAFRFVEAVAERIDVSTVRLLFNKYERGVQPSVATAKNVLGIASVDMIPCDNKGFLTADSYALPYILTKPSGKVGKAFGKLVQIIQKG